MTLRPGYRWTGTAPLRAATLDDLAALMAAAGRSGCPVRDQALVAFYLGTGLRKMEATGLDIEDLRMDADQAGTAVVRKAKRVKGRTVQARVIALIAGLAITWRRCWTATQSRKATLRTRAGARLGQMGAYKVVVCKGNRAGRPGRQDRGTARSAPQFRHLV